MFSLGCEGRRMKVEVKDFSEATHWVAMNDENSDVNGVTVGKAYEIRRNEMEQEYYIIDDRGLASLIFLASNGKLIKRCND